MEGKLGTARIQGVWVDGRVMDTCGRLKYRASNRKRWKSYLPLSTYYRLINGINALIHGIDRLDIIRLINGWGPGKDLGPRLGPQPVISRIITST